MTDKEMAKKYRESLWQRLVDEDEFERLGMFDENVEEAWLAGLEAGRPKWHKVADGDLQKEEAEYLVIFESDGTRYRGLESYYPDEKVWSTICNIIVWCEIPKYTEE